MRISLISQNFDKYSNGESRTNYEIAKYLLSKGHEVHIYAYKIEKELFEKGSKIYKVPLIIERPAILKSIIFFLWVSLIIRMKKNKYDIIYQSGPSAFVSHNLNVCQFCHSAYRKKILKFKFPILRKIYYYINYTVASFMEKIVYKKAKIIVAVSEKIKKELIKYVKIKKDRIVIIHNGVDIEKFTPKKANEKSVLCKKLNINENKKIFLFVGDLNSPRKGFLNLIKVFEDLEENCILLALGKYERGIFHKLVEKKNLKRKIIFLGFQKDTPFFYRSADFMIFPTFYDPCPLVVMESLASGTPCIVSHSRYCGSTEIIEDKKEGFIIKNPHNIEEIKEKINYAITLNKREYLKMCFNARKKAENFSWNKIIEKYYKTLLSRKC